MVLIMLAAMMIAGVALIRVVDSANMISGNFAFRQATLSIADLGTESAAKMLVDKILVSSDLSLREAPYPTGCVASQSGNCVYFPAARLEDTQVARLPKEGLINNTETQVIDWSVKNPVGNLPGYYIRYVIERQCVRVPVVDVIADCITDTPQSGASKKGGATVLLPESRIFYRVSIQVTGPRNTQSHVQVMLKY